MRNTILRTLCVLFMSTFIACWLCVIPLNWHNEILNFSFAGILTVRFLITWLAVCIVALLSLKTWEKFSVEILFSATLPGLVLLILWVAELIFSESLFSAYPEAVAEWIWVIAAFLLALCLEIVTSTFSWADALMDLLFCIAICFVFSDLIQFVGLNHWETITYLLLPTIGFILMVLARIFHQEQEVEEEEND